MNRRLSPRPRFFTPYAWRQFCWMAAAVGVFVFAWRSVL